MFFSVSNGCWRSPLCEEGMNDAENASRCVKLLQQMNMRRVDVSREEVTSFEDLVDADDEDVLVLNLLEAPKDFVEKSSVFWVFVIGTQNAETGKR